MLLLASLMALLGASNEVIVSTKEPLPPARMDIQFNAECGGASLRLSGIAGGRLPMASPALFIDKRQVAISPSATEFLSRPRSSYRLYTVCDGGGKTFYLRLYRVTQGLGGESQFSKYALNVTPDGVVDDSGEISTDAESFWYQ